MSEITFPDAVRGVINCSSKPMDGVKVKIGPLTDTPHGAVLKISWQGLRDSEGQTPIPGANATPITAAVARASQLVRRRRTQISHS